MTIEDRLRESLAQARATIPVVPAVVSRRTRKRASRPVIALACVVLAIAALGAVGPRVATRQPLAATEGGVEFTIGGRTYPVERVLAEDPLVVLPALGPEPHFDTDDLGPDLTPPIEDEWQVPAIADNSPVVAYVGEVGGQGLFAYQRIAFSPLGFVGDILDDGVLNGLVCTARSQGESGCGVADDGGFSGGGSLAAPGLIAHYELRLLPEGVAVVAWSADGEPLGWSRPRGGVAAIAFESPGEGAQIEFEFYDAEGDVVTGRD
jgi:hypothetical protein